MTLSLGEEDQVHYYQGLPGEAELKSVGYGPNGIRNIILEHLNRYPNRCPSGKDAPQPKGCWDPIFVVKPNSTSRYQNLVDILDELQINGVTKYSYTEPTSADSTLLADYRKK